MSEPAEPGWRWSLRVYIEDTDAGGIVYHANYLRYMERARTEFIRYLGFPRLETIDTRVMFVVHSLSMQYLQAARLDDELTVTARPQRIGKTFLDFEQVIHRAETVLSRGDVRVACIWSDRPRSAPLPPSLREQVLLWLARHSSS